VESHKKKKGISCFILDSFMHEILLQYFIIDRREVFANKPQERKRIDMIKKGKVL
jgi:hypothetical protein